MIPDSELYFLIKKRGREASKEEIVDVLRGQGISLKIIEDRLRTLVRCRLITIEEDIIKIK